MNEDEPNALYQMSCMVFLFLGFCFLTGHVADDVFALCGIMLVASGCVILWNKLGA
jgi:hypothetical protein